MTTSTFEEANEYAMMTPRKQSPSRSSSAATRRLTDTDVRAIFEALHNNHPAPPHVPFKIVRVGPNGLKLSPPSYEFEGK